jgi:hypothetical protein
MLRALHRFIGEKSYVFEIGCHFEQKHEIIISFIKHMHTLLLLPRNLKDSLLLTVFVWTKLIHEFWWPFKEINTEYFKLKLFVVLYYLVSEVDVGE